MSAVSATNSQNATRIHLLGKPQLSNTRFYTKFASIECREALNAVAISNSGTMFATGGM